MTAFLYETLKMGRDPDLGRSLVTSGVPGVQIPSETWKSGEWGCLDVENQGRVP